MKERLQKVIRDVGLASRREAEEWILKGRIQVNGEVITELGSQADIEVDEILVDGQPIRPKEEKVYFLFYKPKEVVTTMKDPQGRKTVADYFSSIPERVFPVGRLDFDTEGLLILTNDGELMNGLLHPSQEIPKCYQALVKGCMYKETAMELEEGIKLSDGWTAPAECKLIWVDREKEQTLLELTIHEGRNRQVRRMLGAAGHPVISLMRTGFSFLTLKGMRSGESRTLTEEEIKRLQSLYE